MSAVLPQTFVVRRGDAERLGNATRAIARHATQGDVTVLIQQYEPERSDQQHGLFWSWCETLARKLREAGQPCCKESVHDWILGAVYGWEDMGLGRTRPRRTLTRPHQLGKLAMVELLTRFEADANTEFGIALPRPASWQADLAELAKARAA